MSPLPWLFAAIFVQAPAPLATPTPAVESPAKPRTHLLVAQVAKLDPRRRWVIVKTADQPPLELQIGLDEAKTRVTSGGRAVKIDELRPGARVAISCTDDAAGAHRARLVVIRPRDAGVAAPPS